MYIAVTPSGPPAVREPEDLRRLSIVASPGQSPTSVVGTLLSASLATPGSTPVEVKLNVAAFRDAARKALPDSPTPEWESSFAAMLDYAEHKGWYEPRSGTVAAHIEWMDSIR